MSLLHDEQLIEVISVPKGAAIFRAGRIGHCMYAVESGKVGIFIDDGGDSEKLLNELRKGDIFGEMGMMRGCPHTATAVALDEHTKISIITWNTLGAYFKNHPAKIVGFMQQMGDRIEALTLNFIETCNNLKQAQRQIEALCEENKRLSERCRQSRSLFSKPEQPMWEQIEQENKKQKQTATLPQITYRPYSLGPTIEESREVKQIIEKMWNDLDFEQRAAIKQCRSKMDLMAFAGREGLELPDELMNNVSGGINATPANAIPDSQHEKIGFC